jgi:hypothetical protein
VGGEPIILVERTDGNVMAAFRSLDDIPVPGPQRVEASAAADPPANTQPRAVPNQQQSGKKATPTPTPRKKR